VHSSHASAGCVPTIDDLHRRIALMAELARRLDALVARMPTADASAAWWGPTREAVQVALDLERERLRREALRAHGAADQLRSHLAAASSLVPTGLP